MNNNASAFSTGNEEIYKRFVDEFSRWGSTGKVPDIASLDLRYALELQRKRLENNGAVIDSVYNLRGEHLDNIGTARFMSDPGRYKSQIVFRSYENLTDYKIENRTKCRKKENQVLYLMITRLENQNVNLSCCCPNCGAVSDIRTLLAGCPSCSTRFIIDDLFPKVTNFFTVTDYGETKKSISRSIAIWLAAGAAVGAVVTNLIALAVNSFNGNNLDLGIWISNAVCCTIGGGISGAICGYFCWAIAKIFSLAGSAAKSLPYLKPNFSARKKLPELMASVDKNFSYEYFVGKILSLLKIMIFCDDYQNLAVYDGPPMQNIFKDIIDVKYRGAIKLKSFEVKGMYCYVGVTVYTTVFCEKAGKIEQKNEQFTMTVCQNINSLADTSFTLKSVVCKSCGGSFDATREHSCPYCGNAYHLGNDDWVVLSFAIE